jgi:hypothetical protein
MKFKLLTGLKKFEQHLEVFLYNLYELKILVVDEA